MHSSHSSRRQRKHKNGTHDTDYYRTPVQQDPYDNSRIPSSSTSRHHAHSDPWRGPDDVERDSYVDVSSYRRRDEYERDREEWAPRSFAPTSAREDWLPRYEHEYRGPVYQDAPPAAVQYEPRGSPRYEHRASPTYERRGSPTYDRRGSPAYERRGSPIYDNRQTPSYDPWPLENYPPPPPPPITHIEPVPVPIDRPDRDRNTRRRNDEPRNGINQIRQSDSGWATRREREKTTTAYVSHTENVEANMQERSWEPAPSWRSAHSSTSQQASYRDEPAPPSQRHHRNGGKNKNKSAKRNHYQRNRSPHKHLQETRRNWRDEDGDLNNWKRRDTNTDTKRTWDKPSKSSYKRKHPRSRSRSRSPVESVYSRRSRSRTRSLSPDPKRQRRDSVSSRARSRTPDRASRISHSKRNQSPPSSQRSNEKRKESRRSYSPASETSFSSRSPSPPQRRSVHRLPTATPVDLRLAEKIAIRGTGNHKHDRRSSPAKQKSVSSGAEAMPPPSFVPTLSLTETTVPPLDTSPTSQAPSVLPSINSSPSELRSTTKKAGFRPIGQSAELKRFFPDEEENDDLGHQESLKVPEKETSSIEPAAQPIPVDVSKVLEPPPSATDSPPRPMSVVEDSPLPPIPQVTSRDFRLSQSSHPTPSPDFSHGQQSVSNVSVNQPEPVMPPGTLDRHPSPRYSARGGLYKIVSQVGEGTFGKVYKARNTSTGLPVALKRIRMETERDGFPVTAMREIKLLQSLRHPNVIHLYEMMVSNGSVYMVFQYMDHDLTGILSQSQFAFEDAHLKSLCHQMLSGLAYLHHKGVIHRDIKGSNILINNRGELKLADFGLARFYHKRRRADYTNRVITLWYRPPELLFGATVYGPEVDMWSAGCIMLELYTKRPVFQGNDEIHQLDVIYKIIGTPTIERWPEVMNLPWYELVKPKEAIQNHFRLLFEKWMSPAALDLAEKLLAYNPSERVSAAQAMVEPYFTQERPPALMPTGLATLEGEWHELETKRERAKKRRKVDVGPPPP